jgi:hypothetical protein
MGANGRAAVRERLAVDRVLMRWREAIENRLLYNGSSEPAEPDVRGDQ